MAQYITLKKAKLNPGSHQSAWAGLWRKAWINQLRFLLFHWDTLCCTELTCHNVHWKGLCIRSVQACKKFFFTSKVYLHCLSFSTAGLLQQSQQFICIRLAYASPFCLSVGVAPARKLTLLLLGVHSKGRDEGRRCRQQPISSRIRRREGN